MNNRKMSRSAGLTLSLALACTTTAYAANLQVTNYQDSGPGSLRQAITDANLTTEADTISFSFSGAIPLMSTLPPITSMIAIDGSGRNITVSGNNAVRVMQVESTGTLELRHLTIANGFTESIAGGGIQNYGSVTVRNCIFLGNTAGGELTAFGGAIYNHFDGTLSISDSTLSGNRAVGRVGYGGGVFTYGTLSITRSTFVQNTSTAGGGAVMQWDGTASVSNSTFSGNRTEMWGGAILSLIGTFTLTNNTVYGNSAAVGGGITIDRATTIDMANNIVAGNTGSDCIKYEAPVRVTGPNLVQDGSCSASLSGDPRLGPLAENGGPTQTHALLGGSPAIDAGNDAICSTAPVNREDQRGQPRPAGAHCDLGAYEHTVLYQFSGFLPPAVTTCSI